MSHGRARIEVDQEHYFAAGPDGARQTDRPMSRTAPICRAACDGARWHLPLHRAEASLSVTR
jgi:hypothetical protein